jgi:fibro-slime domain-containing protein
LTGLTTTTDYTIDTCSAGAATPTRIDHKGVQIIQSATSFKQWYADSQFSTKSVGFLELAPLAGSTNTYQFTASNGRTLYDDIHDIWLTANNKPAVSTPPATSLSSGWFPLNDNTGPHTTKLCNLWPYWGLTAAESTACVRKQYDQRADTDPNKAGAEGAEIASVKGVMRNYYFTTEARYLFRYKGGEVLAFHGDDDVWVYVNGKLVLDMGSTHERLEGTVTLSATGANAVLRSQDVVTQIFSPVGTAQTTGGLGLIEGNTYEIAIFHADHHPRDSNYQLTLTGFSRTYSECAPTCGDGVATVGEECDDGPANQDGVYGACTTKCLYGPFCGDGVQDAEEQCDLGRGNTGAYGADGCTPACTRAHFCGDGILDSAFGESCDAGAASNSSCGSDCQIIMQ